MHIAILGAGALGRALGARLATLGKVDVDFVVREARLRVARDGAIALERVGGDALTLAKPSYVASLPAHADAIVVCVRANQLDDALIGALQQGPSAPVVVVTPMLPKTRARVAAALPGRLFAAMSNVTAYTNAAGVTRHWVSRSTRFLIDEPRPADAALTGLATALGSAGIDAGFALGAHEMSAAVVLAMLPIFIATDIAGSVDALVGDRKLLKLAAGALTEARALAERCGAVPPWVRLLDRFSGSLTAKVGLALAQSRSPEIVSFVSDHFGRKSHAQNVALGAELLALAAEKGAPSGSIRALVEMQTG